MVSSASSSAVLIAAGVLASGLGLMGRWPERIAMSGNEVSWSAVEDVAEKMGDAPEVLEELVNLRARLDQLQANGYASEHPAVSYDRDVSAALNRVRPSGRVTRSNARSNRVADFVLDSGAGRLNIETKWQPDVTAPFRGRTLPELLSSLGPRERLLVISNAADIKTAVDEVRASMGDRGVVVRWQGRHHDSRLREAIDLLERHRQADSRQKVS